MSLGRPQPQVRVPVMPTGEEIAGYSAYLQAQQAVDYLAEQRFPVEKLVIVGSDLHSVERVTGRLSYGRVALAGAMSGAWFGLFVGLLLSLFGGAGMADGITFIAIGLGAGFGLLFSVLSYSLTRSRRDFTSQTQTVASRYSLLCSADAAIEARRLLLGSPVGIGTVTPAVVPTPMAPVVPTVTASATESEPVAPGSAGQVVIIEQPTVGTPPVGASAITSAATPEAVAAEAKPVDTRWRLPNGMPRYGALASEVEPDALEQAMAAAAAPTTGTPARGTPVVASAVVAAEPVIASQVVVPGDSAGVNDPGIVAAPTGEVPVAPGPYGPPGEPAAPPADPFAPPVDPYAPPADYRGRSQK